MLHFVIKIERKIKLRNKRAVKVKVVEKEYINNARLVEYLANKYRSERIIKDGNL